jgi:hypothetical protein
MPIEYLRPGWVGISKQWLRRHDLKIQTALGYWANGSPWKWRTRLNPRDGVERDGPDPGGGSMAPQIL